MGALKRNLIKFESFLFYTLIFLLPTQFGYHFWPDYAFVFGVRVDYLSPTLYITDILVILLISISRTRVKTSYLLAIAFFACINILVSVLPFVSLVKWVKVIELVFFAKYVYDHYEFIKNSKFINIVSVSFIFISLIGISQFIKGSTLGGILYFFGERSFDINTPGIALQNLFGQDYLRAYSTFSHPNSFAGFLIFGLVYLISFKPKKWLIYFSTVVASVSLFLTFSLSAIIALLFMAFKKVVKWQLLLPIVLLFSLLLPFVTNNPGYPLEVRERIDQAKIAKELIIQNPLLGSGLGTFTSFNTLLQPVHNIYLLVLTELGVIGFLIFIYLVYKLLKTSNVYYIVPILIIGFFDHYFLTLQQNLLLMAFIIGAAIKHEKS